jgi:hypothetical protein
MHVFVRVCVCVYLVHLIQFIYLSVDYLYLHMFVSPNALKSLCCSVVQFIPTLTNSYLVLQTAVGAHRVEEAELSAPETVVAVAPAELSAPILPDTDTASQERVCESQDRGETSTSTSTSTIHDTITACREIYAFHKNILSFREIYAPQETVGTLQEEVHTFQTIFDVYKETIESSQDLERAGALQENIDAFQDKVRALQVSQGKIGALQETIGAFQDIQVTFLLGFCKYFCKNLLFSLCLFLLIADFVNGLQHLFDIT